MTGKQRLLLTQGAQSSPSTPKRLQEVLTGKRNKLKDTPISPQGIMRNHLVKTNVRTDNLEQSIIDVRETQNQQLDLFNKIVQRLDQLTGLNDRKQQEDVKFLIDELAQKTSEADSAKVKINELDIILSNKEDVIEEPNNQCIQLKIDLEKEQAKHTTQVNDQWIERIKELETIIHNNNTEIHSLNNECAQLKQQLHSPSKIIEGTDDKKANDEWTERIKELETIIHNKDTEIHNLDNECAQLKQRLDDMEKIQVPLEEVSETSDDQKERKPELAASEDILEKILKELDEMKGLKEEIKHLQHHNLTTPKNEVEVFSDSFFKYVDRKRCFGKDTEVIINNCFTLDDLMNTLLRKEKDVAVTKVLIQCGFNDFVRNKSKASQVFENTQEYIQLLRMLYPEAVILVGEILPHPNDQLANNGIKAANHLLAELYNSLEDNIRFVQHPVCRVDNEMYDQDGVHLNEKLGTLQMLKDFYRVNQGKPPFSTKRSQNSK